METGDPTGVIIGGVIALIIALALALVILHHRRRHMRRNKARGPHPLQRPISEAHEPQPTVATAAPELNPAASEGNEATEIEVGELTMAEAPEKAPPVPLPVPVNVNVNIEINVNVDVPAEPALEAQSQSVLVPKLPDLTSAASAPNVIPALELRYAIGSSVYVKRSNGEETVAFVKEYNAEKALYTVELLSLIHISEPTRPY